MSVDDCGHAPLIYHAFWSLSVQKFTFLEVTPIAFALGRHDTVTAPFDAVRIFCEDADGSRYRFDRSLGGEVNGVLQAHGGKELSPASSGSFPIEYIGQGELTDVAKESLSSPAALQTFLDGHMNLGDLIAQEAAVVRRAEVLAAQLAPLMVTFESLTSLSAELEQVQAKLKAREEAKLKEIALFQNRINAERSYQSALALTAQQYRGGVSFRNLLRDAAQLRQTARLEESSVRAVAEAFAAVESVVQEANAYLAQATRDIARDLKVFATRIDAELSKVPAAHESLQSRIDTALDKLRQDNLASAIKEFNDLSSRKSEIVARIDRIEVQRSVFDDVRFQMADCLGEIAEARAAILKKRKEQLTAINTVLKRTFEQYVIQVIPDHRGITTHFEALLDEKMNGSRFTREQMKTLAQDVTPQRLADLVEAKDVAGLTEIGLGGGWAEQVQQRLGVPSTLLVLRLVWKPYVPVFKVLLKGEEGRTVDFNTLSDGQKCTILLTVALMSESRVPLVMDQPEDDLDNQFVFQTVVSTLRAVKEMRQVILVTHNANIAVLGDAELMIGMEQIEGSGRIASSGSIDDRTTKSAVQTCLEGGAAALRRRAAVYGWKTSASI